MFIADNYNLLRRLDNDSIDLVVTDPPFGKHKTWTAKKMKDPIKPEENEAERVQMATWDIHNRKEALSKGIHWPEETEYPDMWKWEEKVHERWMDRIRYTHPVLYGFIFYIRDIHSDSHGAYLAYMAVRLIEIQRILKPTGSVYLHCDPGVSHYLKMLMDAIFGEKNFRNEIIWKRSTSKGTRGRPKTLGSVTDTILFYSVGPEHVIAVPKVLPKKPEKFPHEDARGPYRAVTPLFGDASLHDCRRFVWNEMDPDYGWRVSLETLEKLSAEDRIHIKDSGRPYRKQYEWEYEGVDVGNLWDDIPIASGKERTGYPTQKPVDLAKRMIEASSNKNDVVLDPFAGCAYVPVAAEGLGRQWIACDISVRALTVVRRQFNKFGYSVDGEQITVKMGEQGEKQAALLSVADITVRGPEELPERTPGDVDPEPPPENFEPSEPPPLMGQYYKPKEALEYLLSVSGWMCWGCGQVNTRWDPNLGDNGGWVKVESARNFQADHIDPKSAGGPKIITNMAPLCADCNGRKGARKDINIHHLRDKVVEAGELCVPSVDDLPVPGEMMILATEWHGLKMAEKMAKKGRL